MSQDNTTVPYREEICRSIVSLYRVVDEREPGALSWHQKSFDFASGDIYQERVRLGL